MWARNRLSDRVLDEQMTWRCSELVGQGRWCAPFRDGEATLRTKFPVTAQQKFPITRKFSLLICLGNCSRSGSTQRFFGLNRLVPHPRKSRFRWRIPCLQGISRGDRCDQYCVASAESCSNHDILVCDSRRNVVANALFYFLADYFLPGIQPQSARGIYTYRRLWPRRT